MAGEKRWLVYEPVLELPLKNQRYSSALGAPGEPVLDVTLRAGDTMYLPRGWLHQALTSGSDSLHITVGVNVRRWIDEAHAELDEQERELAFRETIDGAEPPELPALDADAVRRRARERFVRSRRPILDGQLSELRSARRAHRRDGARAARHGDRRSARDDGSSSKAATSSFPERLAAELEFLLTAPGPFRAADLPGSLDAAGRLVLVRRLVREGFLRRSGSAA